MSTADLSESLDSISPARKKIADLLILTSSFPGMYVHYHISLPGKQIGDLISKFFRDLSRGFHDSRGDECLRYCTLRSRQARRHALKIILDSALILRSTLKIRWLFMQNPEHWVLM